MSENSVVEARLAYELSADGKHYKITGCDRYATHVIFPEEHQGLPVIEICSEAFKGCKKLGEVAISKKIRVIGDAAFESCESLTRVTIPDNVRIIGEGVFKGCRDLQVFAQAKKTPVGWSTKWKGCRCTVVWGADLSAPISELTNGAALEKALKEVVDNQASTAAEEPVLNNNFESVEQGLVNLLAETLSDQGSPDNKESVDINEDLTSATEIAEESDSQAGAFESTESFEEISEELLPEEPETSLVTARELPPEVRGKVDAASALLTAKKWRKAKVAYKNLATEHPELPDGSIGLLLVALKLTDEALLPTLRKPFDKQEAYKNIINGSNAEAIERVIAYHDDVMHTVALEKAGYTFEEKTKGYVLTAIKSRKLRRQRQLELPSRYRGRPVIEIGERALYKFKKLENVIIPDTVVTITRYAFSECKRLRKVDIPGSVTWIGVEAFAHCISLLKVTVPASVEKIQTKAFYDSPFLKIYCEAKNKPDVWVNEWNSLVNEVVWGRLSDESTETSKDNSIYILTPEAKTLAEAANELLRMGAWEKARDSFKAFLEKYPDVPDGYIGYLLARYHAYEEYELGYCTAHFEKTAEYKRLLELVDVDAYNRLKQYEAQAVDTRRIVRQKRKEECKRIVVGIFKGIGKLFVGLFRAIMFIPMCILKFIGGIFKTIWRVIKFIGKVIFLIFKYIGLGIFHIVKIPFLAVYYVFKIPILAVYHILKYPAIGLFYVIKYAAIGVGYVIGFGFVFIWGIIEGCLDSV